ncbi:hypothetical protein [Desulfonatronum thiodismutans]|uniref:hypothetical protein n=1 Tax=Desulfonatronum thiodismutans TaxID=159290 RepID=UPI0012689F1A|nr:hypothetical protein [Desulfonatronum thiodismutans]
MKAAQGRENKEKGFRPFGRNPLLLPCWEGPGGLARQGFPRMPQGANEALISDFKAIGKCGSFIESLRQKNAQGTATEVVMSEGQGECAIQGGVLAAFEVAVQPEIFCLADILKVLFLAPEIFRALYFGHDPVDGLVVFFMHTAGLSRWLPVS